MYFIDEICSWKPSDLSESAEKEIILQEIHQHGETLLLRSHALAHMTATAMVLNRERNKILMVHHNIFDTWACVGGHADGMTDLCAVARKEVAEETGLVHLQQCVDGIASLDILQVAAHLKNGNYVPNHLHLNATYVFFAEEKDALRIKPDENSAVAWIAVSELDSHTKEKEFLNVYHKILKRFF